MAVDRYGNPIFSTDPLPSLTGLTLPTPAISSSLPLQSLLDSIKAPQLSPPEEETGSNTLALLLNALGNRGIAGGGGGGGASTKAGGKSDWVRQIKRLAPKYGLDAAAVLAVASAEGLGGGVGDAGTSFGPFQLHVGGALPKGKSRAWAESPAGIEYALRKISSVAKGLKGESAITAIVRQFERPARPGAEISKARSRYGKVG